MNAGELRGIIGPNGAGKSTFFKMLTCEVHPTSGKIVFEGRDITGMSVTDVCQLGLTKSYQVNQLFNKLTVRENITIAALAELRGKMRLDMLRNPDKIAGLERAGKPDARARAPHRAASIRPSPSSPTARSAAWKWARPRLDPEPPAAGRAARRQFGFFFLLGASSSVTYC